MRFDGGDVQHALRPRATLAGPGRMEVCAPCGDRAAAEATQTQRECGREDHGKLDGVHRKRHALWQVLHATAPSKKQRLLTTLLLIALAAASCAPMAAAAAAADQLDNGQCCTAPTVITGSKPRPKR